MASDPYAEIFEKFGLKLEDYIFKLGAASGPDKFYSIFKLRDGGKEILAILEEDYIENLQYAKDSFVNELGVELVTLHKEKENGLYSIDLDGNEVYVATVRPLIKNSDYWDTLRVRLRSVYRGRPYPH